jgi:hypothetical protein
LEDWKVGRLVSSRLVSLSRLANFQPSDLLT